MISQDHRTTETGGRHLLEITSSNNLLSSGAVRADFSGACFGWVLSRSIKGGCTTSLGTLTVEFFFYIYMEFPLFPFVSIASCPVTGQQGGGPGLHLLCCSHQVFIHMERVSLSFLQDEQSQLCQPLIYVTCCKSFVIPLALCWAHSSTSTSVLQWGAQNGIQHSGCASPILNKGEG